MMRIAQILPGLPLSGVLKKPATSLRGVPPQAGRRGNLDFHMGTEIATTAFGGLAMTNFRFFNRPCHGSDIGRKAAIAMTGHRWDAHKRDS